MQAIESTTEPPVSARHAAPAAERLKSVAVVCVVIFVPGYAGYFGCSPWQIGQREVALARADAPA